MTLRFAPAAERNKVPILAVLRRYLPPTGKVLEVASGTGQHAAFFAAELEPLLWQPTDRESPALESIEAHRGASGLSNLLPARRFDVIEDGPPEPGYDAMVCINMIHIAPPAATEALLRHASELLPDEGPLVLYGPFRVAGDFTAPSNEAFDASLRGRNAAWGLRDLEWVEAIAERVGLRRTALDALPANNHAVVFRRTR